VRRPKRDYYEVLGMPRTADTEAIRRAFRRLARELHPDVSASPGADEQFREISAAYDTLSKPRARFLYDRFGYRGQGEGGFQNGAPPGPARVLAEVELEAFEAARGVRRQVVVADVEVCEACEGSGAAFGSRERTCETCLGKGTVRVSSGLGVGRWLQVEPCGDCGGAGRLQRLCPKCRGAGEWSRRRAITVRIPAGVEDGTRLRVSGEPESSHLVVRVRPLPGDSLLIRYAAAALCLVAVAFSVFLLFALGA
jgi:molecular chaperone DnaJ